MFSIPAIPQNEEHFNFGEYPGPIPAAIQRQAYMTDFTAVQRNQSVLYVLQNSIPVLDLSAIRVRHTARMEQFL